MALTNICRCHPSASLYITDKAHGCHALPKALETMKDSQKVVEIMLIAISAILDTCLPDIQEKLGICKIGQSIVASMLAHKEVVIIQQMVRVTRRLLSVLLLLSMKKIRSDLLCALIIIGMPDGDVIGTWTR